MSAADEELLVRALCAKAIRDAGGVLPPMFTAPIFTAEELSDLAAQARDLAAERLVRAAVHASAWGQLSATTIALVTIDTRGLLPEDAALIVHGITVALPLQGILPSGDTSPIAAHRIATALERLGYQLTEDGLTTTLRSTDTLAFPVTRKQPVKLRIVAAGTT